MPVTRSNKGSERRESTPVGTAEASAPVVPATSEHRVQETAATRAERPASRLRVAPERDEPTETSTEPTTEATTTSYETTVTETTKRPDDDSRAKTRTANRSRAASVKSDLARRRKELEMRAELAEQELREAQARTAATRARLELLQLAEEDESDAEDPRNKEADVRQWLEETADTVPPKEHDAHAFPKELMETPEKECIQTQASAAVKPDQQPAGTKDLAEAIIRAIQSVPKGGASVPSYVTELPFFDGAIGEWLAFRTVYEDTEKLFTAPQNMARLRRAIKGAAREAVKSLLYSECRPEDIMDALKRRFGRPDTLVLAEMEKLKRLAKISESAHDVCSFASQVNNVVATVKGLRKPQYLQSPEIMRIIVEKLPAVLKYRWFDYAANYEECNIATMAAFLNREADRCGPYALTETALRRQGAYRPQAAHTATDVAEERKPACPHCRGEHALTGCKRFLQASVKERWEIATRSRVCFKCLGGKHRKENCKKPACKECKRMHHNLLHARKEEEATEEAEISNNVRLPVNTLSTTRAYLKIVPVKVFGPEGSLDILALLDEGSTVTLLDASVADKLGLAGPKVPLRLETVGGETLGSERSMKFDMRIKGLHHPRTQRLVGVRTIEGLNLTPQILDEARLRECSHLSRMSFGTEEEAIRVAQDVDHIHRRAGFELRGWASNRPAVSSALSGEVVGEEVELGSKEEKTLGLRWFTTEDTMGFRTEMRNIEEDVTGARKTPTKRQVTSAVMSTFDPMGLASPVLIQGKRLLQNLWRSGVGWDDLVTPESEESWREYLLHVQLLESLRIPRCFASASGEGELHTFTDASEAAYACAVYWREKKDGVWTTHLLAGKARVTPLKPVSIPRLELQAALLGTRLAQSVLEELDVVPKRRTYWTDSSTVLAWIRSDPRTFKPFVAHRLAEIEDTSRPDEWRWVPTSQNPADDATRRTPKDFTARHRWFTGPDFLAKEEDKWPEHRRFKTSITGEEKETKHLVAVVSPSSLPTPDPVRFSRWVRLLRATARVLQFVHLCRKEKALSARSSDPVWTRKH
ncbi:unnamed protein product [Danaus chrysippus]|uniref:(African queen) hypothetical protein n=1 Tax=Danaus chrysippus TaxID=151541 RepID=A0A8J2R3H2_9NEOP|nr:unnamed protein product [Danaus chrysippus]